MNSVFEPQTITGCLEAAAADVLETMFFAAAEATQPPGEERAGRLGVSLQFHGAAAGKLRLTIDQDAAERLATNFYGAESTLVEARSVLPELANMICGTLLSRLDTEAIFCLGEPQAEEAPLELAGESAVLLRVEDGLLALQFEIGAAGEMTR
jgi:CheY-specific phosphatase CheX